MQDKILTALTISFFSKSGVLHLRRDLGWREMIYVQVTLLPIVLMLQQGNTNIK